VVHRSRELCSLALALGATFACEKADRPASDRGESSAAEPADSFALRSNEVEIWYTLARPSSGTDGSRCVERGLEIRRGGKRIPVPLLYTGESPTLIDDSTLRATLWTDCRPTEVYRVDLRNGRPVRESTEDRP
jgi:hypothetical protein